MKSIIQEKVMKIVSKITGGRVKTINFDGDLRNELSIDSVQLVELFALLEKEFQEIMTMHEDRTIFGSIWALSRQRLENYKDFYSPKPEVLLLDKSIDIHTWEDFQNAKNTHNR